MGLSRRQRLLSVLSGLAFFGAWLIFSSNAPDLSHENTKSLLVFIGLVTVLAVGHYWKFSPQWYRLRDRIFATLTDGTYGNKRRNLRAVGIGLIVVLSALAAICVYAVFFYQ